MAPGDLRNRSQPWATWLRDIILIGTAMGAMGTFFLGVFFAGAMSIYGPTLRVQAQEWLGITAVYDRIAEIAGDTRVIAQPEGLSYVRTPILQGEDIELVLVIGRTDRGAECILREIIPLFTDDTGNVVAGEARRPTSQLSPAMARRELVLPYPVRLRPGRAALQLQLEYECDGQTVFETTYPTPFEVLPRETH